MKPARQRILFVTRHTPLPWDDGAGAYLHGLAAFLADRGHRVEILWLEPHEPIRWQKLWRLPAAFSGHVRLVLPGARRLGRTYLFPHFIWLPLKARALHRIRRLLEALRLIRPRVRPPSAGAPAPGRSWMSPPTPAELDLVATALTRVRPDVIVASYAWMTPVLTLPEARGARRWCLTHDVAWRRARLAATADAPAEVTAERESAWLQSADTIIAISAADARDLHELAPGKRVPVVPKAFAVAGSTPATSAEPRVLFVGSANAFNVGGVRWFLAEAWPEIRSRVPGASFHLCGSVAGALAEVPPGVERHGVVADLAPHYAAAAVVVVPLQLATGLNIKLAEAAAHGCAIVTTPATLDGAPFLQGAIRIASDGPAFAAEVIALLRDPAARASTAARALAAARSHLTPAACYGTLLGELESGPVSTAVPRPPAPA